MDLKAEMERDRREIHMAIIASVIGTAALIALGVGLFVAVRLATTTRCPAPPAGVTLPR
ncbi:hypothetical protein [Methylobacterium fujisawaense]|uniref:hypothetical protein n=1 Tax=Methylobacterium fujisawaense TaxID=107400 RepID=UPI00244B4F3B|nr:hypothetical protein [Methylobacterium fujisawaense]